jgi:hypothetical protein
MHAVWVGCRSRRMRVRWNRPQVQGKVSHQPSWLMKSRGIPILGSRFASRNSHNAKPRREPSATTRRRHRSGIPAYLLRILTAGARSTHQGDARTPRNLIQCAPRPDHLNRSRFLPDKVQANVRLRQALQGSKATNGSSARPPFHEHSSIHRLDRRQRSAHRARGRWAPS